MRSWQEEEASGSTLRGQEMGLGIYRYTIICVGGTDADLTQLCCTLITLLIEHPYMIIHDRDLHCSKFFRTLLGFQDQNDNVAAYSV